MTRTHFKFVVIVVIFLVLVLPFTISDRTDNIVPKIVNENSIGFYQSTTCNISLSEVAFKNYNNSNTITYNNNSYPGLECFGKVTGLDKVGDKYIISIGTNPSANLIIQSILWLLLLLLVSPKKEGHLKPESVIYVSIRSFILAIIFSFQSFSESRYYEKTNIYFSNQFSLENHYFIGIFLSYFLVFILMSEVLRSRERILLNLTPFLFLIVGTYSGMNINIYLMLLSFFGLKELLSLKINIRFNLIFGIFTIFWVTQKNSSNNFFDTDKLRGFINSSNNNSSLYFWIIIIFLVINGLIYLYKVSTLNFEQIKRSMLFSGSGVVFFGFLGAYFPLMNFINYFTFGQNKTGMRGLGSIAGNTWRGFSASAESVGEFFGLIILFCIIYRYKKKISLNLYEYLLLIIIFYGLFKSNNFASVSSVIVLTTIFLIKNTTYYRLDQKKIFIIFALFSFLIVGYFLSSINYQTASIHLLYEVSLNSDFFRSNDSYTNFLSIQKSFEERDLLTLLQKDDNLVRASSSYLVLVNLFTTSFNLKLIPNIVALLSVVSLLINRSEMWGIFFAKYNPNIGEFLFGSGPLQISDYLYKHKVRLDVPLEKLQALYLPHSSFFDILIFYGLIGLTLFILFMSKLLFSKNSKGLSSKYLLIFLILNFLKSDSLLYISSGILLFLIVTMVSKKEFSKV